MNVLSLFDGISAGRQALEKAGIQVDNYFASEIDKYAIAITQYNYPDTVQLGDVEGWQEWDLPKIDIILAGSPCQGFSRIGTRLNFDDPRSKLFFTFMDILEHYNPEYFLLENVVMKKEWQAVITDWVGEYPLAINSKLVSAQSRPRLYWTNLPDVTLPEDRGILLKDIIFDDADLPALHNIYGGYKETEPRKFWDKSPTIRPNSGGGHIPSLILSYKAMEYMCRRVVDGRTHWDFKHHSDIANDKSQTVVANFKKGVPYNVLISKNCVRSFHPIECERLQTMPDDYTSIGDFDGDVKHISKTQRYKALGNSWTVDVIVQLLKGIS